MKHRQTVRDGVILYLGVQVVRVSIGTFANYTEPGMVGMVEAPRLSAAQCVSWGFPAPALDLDSTGVLNQISSIVNSTSSS